MPKDSPSSNELAQRAAMAGLRRSHANFAARRRPVTLAIVVALHASLFVVLQAAFLQKPAEKPASHPIIATLIAPEPPKPEPRVAPPKPPPMARRASKTIIPEVIVPPVDSSPSEAAITPIAIAEAPAVVAPTIIAAPAIAPVASEPLPVSPPRFDAAYLNNPPPTYPPLARRMGQEGKVILRVLVSAEGRAQDVQLRTSSGYARLDEVALETIKQWRFVPARQGGQPIDAWVLVPMAFTLHG